MEGKVMIRLKDEGEWRDGEPAGRCLMDGE